MDDTAIAARLHRAATADSRELDRVCERVAEELIAAGVEPPFDVTSSDFAADPFLICADRYWRLRFLQQPSVSTAAECAVWLARHVETEHYVEVSQKWALGYAFITRDTMESWTELSEATATIVGRDDSACDIAYFATLYHAGKLRSNFWFDELHQFLESALLTLAAGPHRSDPLFIALRAFAALGSRTITAEHATHLLQEAWTSPARTRHVIDICLNGLSAAAPFDAQGELLQHHAEEAVTAYPKDHIFRFRLATGEYMRGRYDTALASIDYALRLLPAIGSRGSHKLLQEQYLAKRDLIQEGILRAKRDAEQQRRWEQQTLANEALDHTMQSSTVRAVELVAIFTAAIAFATGSLQITLAGTMPLHDRLWLLAVFGIGLAGFALLIVGGTWYITRARRQR